MNLQIVYLSELLRNTNLYCKIEVAYKLSLKLDFVVQGFWAPY